MKHLTPQNMSRVALLLLVGGLVAVFAWPLNGAAQDKAPDPAKHNHPAQPADADKDLAAQVRELQDKIAKLEAALKQGHKGAPSGTLDTGGMGKMPMGMMGDKKMGKGMMGMGGMEGMDRDEMAKMMQMMQMMGGMKDMGGGMGMMDMDMDMMGMMGMGSMSGSKGMGKMKMTSALPGFPGASHLYHIGATDFFLDHPEHITLSTEQQTKLNRSKQKALTDKANTQRKIEEAEQQLWEMTGSDEPDAAKIEAKVQAIEKLRSEQRMAFIRAVGEAAKVLTDDQRKALLGTAKPQGHKHTP